MILANQCRILEKLYPDEADGYAEMREVLEHGYELHYRWIAEHVYEETSSEDRCKETLDILEMHEALRFSYDKLADKSGIDPHGVRFMGFDGNNETSELVCSPGCSGEEELQANPSHVPAPAIPVFQRPGTFRSATVPVGSTTRQATGARSSVGGTAASLVC